MEFAIRSICFQLETMKLAWFRNEFGKKVPLNRESKNKDKLLLIHEE